MKRNNFVCHMITHMTAATICPSSHQSLPGIIGIIFSSCSISSLFLSTLQLSLLSVEDWVEEGKHPSQLSLWMYGLGAAFHSITWITSHHNPSIIRMQATLPHLISISISLSLVWIRCSPPPPPPASTFPSKINPLSPPPPENARLPA